MLNSAFGVKLICEKDRLGNLPLHLAAQGDCIPLSLSLIYQKTPEHLRNVPNQLGNTPLSEAIYKGDSNTALFILQACNDPSSF